MEHEKCVHFFCFCFCFVECKYARKITIYTMLITVFKYDPPTPNTYPHRSEERRVGKECW